jgi:hypothetical protein
MTWIDLVGIQPRSAGGSGRFSRLFDTAFPHFFGTRKGLCGELEILPWTFTKAYPTRTRIVIEADLPG